MTTDTPVKLRIPRQDLQDFSYFPLSAEGAREWAQALPVTSSSHVAQQLHAVIARLNRTELDPHLRFRIMEELRRPMLVAIASLSRRFLRQPLFLPHEPSQMAELTESLYALASTAYTIAAVHTIQRRTGVQAINPARLACESIHRAIRMTGAELLQAFQLYRPIGPNDWRTLHQLYAMAEGQKLTRLNVEDELSGSGTISTAYLQAMMLGSCKPNQFRQRDLAAVYRGLQEWGALLTVEDESDRKELFLVSLDSDRPPVHSHLHGEPPDQWTRYIDAAPLVRHLEKQVARAEKGGVVFDKDIVVSPGLLAQVINAFSSTGMRNFARKRMDKTVWVGIGLSCCHYHLAGEKTFEQLIHGEDHIPSHPEGAGQNPFHEQVRRSDLWQQANPLKESAGASGGGTPQKTDEDVHPDRHTVAKILEPDNQAPPDERRFRAHSVDMYDASPSGYCLQWSPDLPGDINSGDIVCLREDESARWSIACIRWISEYEDRTTLVGLELLSPGAESYGARHHQQRKGEEREPVRVLLLPEVKLVGQPHTLITPRTGFRQWQKIVLARHGEESFIQLTRQVAMTASFMQFEFRFIKHLEEVLAEDKSRPADTCFDSLWSNI